MGNPRIRLNMGEVIKLRTMRSGVRISPGARLSEFGHSSLAPLWPLRRVLSSVNGSGRTRHQYLYWWHIWWLRYSSSSEGQSESVAATTQLNVAPARARIEWVERSDRLLHVLPP